MKTEQTNKQTKNCFHVYLNETCLCVPHLQPGRMPLNAGDTGYGSVRGSVLSSSVAASESSPLLIPEEEPEPGAVHRWKPLSREQLEAAAGGPGWRKVRCYLVLIFWLAWLAMLAISIAIVVMSPRPEVTPLRWWQKTQFYQLQPDSEGPGGVRGEETLLSLKKMRRFI